MKSYLYHLVIEDGFAMRMKDIMTRSYQCLGPDDDLRRVARLFRQTRLEALPVVEEGSGRLMGIMTKANLYDAIAEGRLPETPIGDFYSRDVLTLREDASYDQVKEIVRTSRAGSAVIVDGKGEVAGVFTKTGWIMAMLKRETQLTSDLNTLLQTMYNGLVAVDDRGDAAEINRAAEKALPLKEGAAVGRKVGSLPRGDREAKPAPDGDFDHIVTADPVFRQIIDEAAIVSRGTSNILITGESGTGKELIAQAIHRNSAFRTGPLVKVNCAAIPESLMESEFFGYVPGAFTGANRGGKKGKLAMADGGTLFLDEIGDMPAALQGKLLRVIQDKCFEPIGSNTPQKVDVRFIAATNQDIREMLHSGRFRADLFYRLNVIHLHIPPLRSRSQDIPLLVRYFLERYNRIFGTHVSDVTKEAREIFRAYPWPGNVRELENVIERGINFARGPFIGKQDLPVHLRDYQEPASADRPGESLSHRLRPSREDHEREVIIQALERTNGNRARAARALGISRSWLYEKMSKMGLEKK